MTTLFNEVRCLRKGRVKKSVDARVREFRSVGRKPIKEIFSELCFCLLTANYNAERAMKIQEELGEEFLTLPRSRLAKKLKIMGHRFPNARAEYIVEARKQLKPLKEVLKSLKGLELRDWLVKNIKGLGYKESSHFLRNIGYSDYAILDYHIIDVLVKHRLIQRPKTLTKNRYLEIEELLKILAQKLNLSLAELDLYLWYLETSKVLK